MSLLLDTHAMVWWFSGDRRMARSVRRRIEAANAIVYVSAVSAWELANKFRVGKLPDGKDLIDDLPAMLEACSFRDLAITLEHGRRAGLLTGTRRDPFDRMLAAQAIVEGFEIATVDPALAALGARVFW